jgi:hypothetical protein
LSSREQADTWTTPTLIVATSDPATSHLEDILAAVASHGAHLDLAFQRVRVGSPKPNDGAVGLYYSETGLDGTPGQLRRIPHSGSDDSSPSLLIAPHAALDVLFSRMRSVSHGGGLKAEKLTGHGWRSYRTVVRNGSGAAGVLVSRPSGHAPLVAYIA